MLGKAMDLLKELGEENNTIIVTIGFFLVCTYSSAQVFHADHGYQLGELNEWSKKTNTELAVHIPLIIRVPWKTKSIGKRTKVKAELIDIYK
jgi:arylsulfatase A-like enzyme